MNFSKVYFERSLWSHVSCKAGNVKPSNHAICNLLARLGKHIPSISGLLFLSSSQCSKAILILSKGKLKSSAIFTPRSGKHSMKDPFNQNYF